MPDRGPIWDYEQFHHERFRDSSDSALTVSAGFLHPVVSSLRGLLEQLLQRVLQEQHQQQLRGQLQQRLREVQQGHQQPLWEQL